MTKQFSNKCRSLFAFLIAVAIVFTAVPISTIAIAETNADGYIEVDSIEDLYLINQDLTAKYILTADIDMTEATAEGGDWDFDGRGWNPIGSNNVYGDGAFSGEFDGNGHKIIGMRIDVTSLPAGVSDAIYFGLFANVTGTVMNLTLSGSISIVSHNTTLISYVGSISGYCSGRIDNCHNEATISATTPNQSSYIGGIAGYIDCGVVNNSTNRAKINGKGAVVDNTNSRYVAVGGIVGYSNGGTVEYCYNKGNITSVCGDYSYMMWPNYNGADYFYVKAYSAGITGFSTNGTITNSYNIAKISSEYDNDKKGTTYSAGISNGTNVEIRNCYNVESISITGTGHSYAIGETVVNNCYYFQGSGTQISGATSFTKGQMTLENMYEGFDFENVWFLEEEALYPYPQLINNVQDIRIVQNVNLIPPTKTLYYLNEILDLTGSAIKFEFENAESEIITVTEDMISGFDSKTIGEQTITVNCYYRDLDFKIKIFDLPYQEIKTIEDLYNIRDNLYGNYILMNDIDITEATSENGGWNFGGRGWNPIGSNDVYSNGAFCGVFDGNGYSISGMCINYSSKNTPSGMEPNAYVGLFANVAGEIRNLHLKDINIIGAYASADLYVGGIAGYNSGNIINCSVAGNVNASEYGTWVGGIVGYSSGAIVQSYNLANVVGNERAGGIVGKNDSGKVENCYNTGNISSIGTYKQTSGYYTYTYGYNVGGITGGNYGLNGIHNCYNTGKISGYSSKYAYAVSPNGINTNCYYLSGTGTEITGATALTDTQLRLESMFPGFDFENIWTINPYANHPYPQIRSNIQDLSESVEIIRIISIPEKKEYLTDDTLDLTYGVIEAVYISGKTELINITEDMITGFDSSTAGVQTITVTYGGKMAMFSINISQRPAVKGIELISEPDRKNFLVGEIFDFTGAQIKISYEDNTSTIRDITIDMTTGSNSNELGEQTVNVMLYGFTASFKITVSELTLDSLNIDTLPNKLVYLEGESLDTSGLSLSAKFNDGRTVAVTSGYTVSGYSNEAGTHTITVKYLKLTTSFEVEVTARKVISLGLRQMPNKMEYYEGDAFDKTGIVLVAFFDNNELDSVEDYKVSGYDSTVGTKTVTLTYEGCSVSFTVNVNALSLTGIYIEQYPVKTTYIENESLDTTGLVVKATYNNGDTVTVDNYDILGFSSEPGDYTIAISFEGKTCFYDITVTEKVLQDVRITLPAKLTYKMGEAFDATGLVVTAYYNNGQELTVENYVLSGFDSLITGTKEITVEFGGFTRSFAVVVSERINVETGGSIKVENIIGRLGETVVIPVSVTNNSGIAGFNHTITFAENNLKFVSAVAVGDFANGTIIINDEKLSSGNLEILWFGDREIEGDGVVYNLTFEVLETATDGKTNVTISFDENDNVNISGGNVLFGSVSGYVDVRSYWLGDLDGDREFAMVDLLQLAQYVSGKQMTLTEKQLLSADVNEDGIVDIHDVVMLNQWLLVADM